ncbi:MAG: macro domain-containing protein [Dehalococcoidia bacterium]|nr:macro domain-containing protein [Dehalococcoidia bacterium]
MIKYIRGRDLFESQAEALVNPVNCKGAMGKGIAKIFKKKFPECVKPYKKACADNKLIPGKLLLVQLAVQMDFFDWKQPKIILFPTKNHWRGQSRIEWIEQGLSYLRDHYHQWGLKSIAMPQLGCGLGKLKWEDVKLVVEEYFSDEPLKIEVYLRAIYDYGEMQDKHPIDDANTASRNI